MKRLFRVWALFTVCLLGRVLGEYELSEIPLKEIIGTHHNWESDLEVNGERYFKRALKFLKANPDFIKIFNAIILPPVHPYLDSHMQVVVPGHPNGIRTHGYTPMAFWIGSNGYGTQEELRELMDYYIANGITPIADFTVRMMFGQQDPENPLEFFGNPHDLEKEDFHQETDAQGNPINTGATGPFEEYHRLFPGFPNLVHKSPRVFKVLLDYARELFKFGFRGLRVDYARGVSPEIIAEILKQLYEEDPSQVFDIILPEFWTELDYDNVKNNPHDVEFPPKHNQEGAIRAITGWMDELKTHLGELAKKILISAYDKVGYGHKREAVQTGEFSRYTDCPEHTALNYTYGVNGVVGINPDVMTGTGNHDTEDTQNHWPFACRAGGGKVYSPPVYNQALKFIQGYAIDLLISPGITHIFSQHVYPEGMEIGTDKYKLMEILQPEIIKLREISKAYKITRLNKPERKIVRKGYLEVKPSDADILVRMWADYDFMDNMHEAEDRYDKLGFKLEGIYANPGARLRVHKIVPKDNP
jgi:hypothetical protein